ncbi:MAG: helix-turn-helix domain-containing protein [Alphaproteobacteria bacterium]
MEEIVFPNQIRMYRRIRGRTMQELADCLNVSLSAISKIEKGYRRLDQEQLMKVAEFLDCPLQDIFVNEESSQPDVVQAWRKEQERRCSINEKGGLKILGAGLRQIRNLKEMTLVDVAEKSNMTLSVYHRIEMGQREVTDEEFDNMAVALEMSVDELKREIKRLDESGVLKELIQRTDARYRPVSAPRGSYAELLAGRGFLHTDKKEYLLKVYGKPIENGAILIDKEANIGEQKTLPELAKKAGAYCVNLCTRRLGNILPTRSILHVDPTQMVSLGDIALYYFEPNKAKVISVREETDGSLYGLLWNPDEKVIIDENKISSLHKVVMISLG